MYYYKSLVGEKFGQLEVLSKAENRSGHATWLCRCTCGSEKTIRGDVLKQGRTISCGCLSKEKSRGRIKENPPAKTHGMSGDSTYAIYRGMINRCYNEKSKNYKAYGAKGISVCDRWLNSFENFLEDVGLRPSDEHSLERIDSKKSYYPDNVVWATDVQQNRNRSKYCTNKSGKTGVFFLKSGKYKYWLVTSVHPVSLQSETKRFSVLKYGSAEAYRLACLYRDERIEYYNLEFSAGYSDFHGT